MKTQEITPIKPSEGDFGQRTQQNHQHLSKTRNHPTDKTISEVVRPSSLNHMLFNKLENTKAQFHEVAKQIRNVNDVIESVNTHLIKMRSALENIVKIYPPYPQGSSERIKELRQFSGLRDMIDRLAAPPNSKRTEFVNFDSVTLAESLSMDHYQLQNEKGGLDIPHLDSNSSDQQIYDAIEKVVVAQETMGERQQAFVSYANDLISKIS